MLLEKFEVKLLKETYMGACCSSFVRPPNDTRNMVREPTYVSKRWAEIKPENKLNESVSFIFISSSLSWRIIWQVKVVTSRHQHHTTVLKWDQNPWFALEMTGNDEHRQLFHIGVPLGVPTGDISGLIIWGEESNTIPCFYQLCWNYVFPNNGHFCLLGLGHLIQKVIA